MSMSSLTLRTPTSPATASSAALRCRPYSTAPVSVRLPSRAVASTPSGTVTLSASALFVAVVLVGQHDLQVIVHVPDAGHALSGDDGLQVLRIARDGAVESHVPVDVHDMNVRVVDERVELELCLDCRADVFGGAHCCAPFLSGSERRMCRVKCPG